VPDQVTASDGNIFTVRDCEGEDDCVVISKWYPPLERPRDSLDSQINDVLGTPTNDDTDEEPPQPGYRFADDFHIPLACVGDLIESLRKHDRKAGSPMSEPTQVTASVSEPVRCGATIEIENGETVTPCNKPKGHPGEHRGWCLGSVAVWTDDELPRSQREEA